MRSTNQATQILLVYRVLVLGPTLLQEISGSNDSNSLTSFPPQINGRTTACVGDEISVTCSRNNFDFPVTQWTVSSPVNCSSVVNHLAESQAPSPCGPFTFKNFTELGVSLQINSTAVATAASEISGSVIECTTGRNRSILVGNTSLCVIDELPAPVNLRCMEVPRELLVSWDVITDGNSSCARSSIVHDVTLVREADGMTIFVMNNVKNTQIEIADSSLEPSQSYTIHIRTKLIHGTCESDNTTFMCRTSDDLFSTTAPPFTSPETQNGASVSAAAVAVPIVVVLALVAVIVGLLILFGYYKRYGKLPCSLTLPFGLLKDQNSSPAYELTRTPGPGGAMYTDINKAPTKRKDREAQQDHTKNGFSGDSIDKSKDPDAYEGIDEKPPPKPARLSKSIDISKNESKNEPSPPPPPSNKINSFYEDMDDVNETKS